ncbi:MAG TPA: hypothetical protein VMR06_07915 [Dokdonella sp.]|uniref:hypothetical protein n=1 Tax=Dokdonella sp. TaxID=2291710 RepID=UPI002C8A5699|nr:hypothetical protein [Dokdonella sp.]HUD41913.1 hypothetical protein [Dokdonella sp.]
MAKARTLLFVAEGKDLSGNPDSVWVYKQGGSYYLSSFGVSGRTHLCHPSVRDQEGIKREILLVFHFKVEKVIYPHELGRNSPSEA